MPLRDGSCEEAGVDPVRVERLRRTAPRLLGPDNQCLALVAARRGVVFVAEAWGPCGPEPGAAPISLDTIFPFGSVTKVITATCALLLVEDGLLELTKPVQDYIPEFRGDGKAEVLVHHLLTHTSGLSDPVAAPDSWGLKPLLGRVDPASLPPNQHPDVERQLRGIYGAPLSRRPGERHDYSNAGFALAGEIVRRLSQTSLDAFARERLFAPLAMRDSHLVLPSEKQQRVVRRPSTAPFAALDDRRFAETPWAYGGAFGTTRDAAALGQMFRDGLRAPTAVLSPASVRVMTRNQTPGISGALEIPAFPPIDFPEVAVGYPWIVGSLPRFPYLSNGLTSPNAFFHSGAGGAMLYCDPDFDVVIAMLSVIARNRDDGFPRSATLPLIDMVLASAI